MPPTPTCRRWSKTTSTTRTTTRMSTRKSLRRMPMPMPMQPMASSQIHRRQLPLPLIAAMHATMLTWPLRTGQLPLLRRLPNLEPIVLATATAHHTKTSRLVLAMMQMAARQLRLRLPMHSSPLHRWTQASLLLDSPPAPSSLMRVTSAITNGASRSAPADETVVEWLKRMDLSALIPVFEREELCDWDIVKEITPSSLQTLNLPLGARLKFMRHLRDRLGHEMSETPGRPSSRSTEDLEALISRLVEAKLEESSSVPSSAPSPARPKRTTAMAPALASVAAAAKSALSSARPAATTRQPISSRPAASTTTSRATSKEASSAGPSGHHDCCCRRHKGTHWYLAASSGSSTASRTDTASKASKPLTKPSSSSSANGAVSSTPATTGTSQKITQVLHFPETRPRPDRSINRNETSVSTANCTNNNLGC
ncbi:hypothetical protein BC831DRAFT_75833 [Entophlyctis helioformis]|nr:hypothetical protein BC831DRAFT_75833 [Entophlyctis helioformis]